MTFLNGVHDDDDDADAPGVVARSAPRSSPVAHAPQRTDLGFSGLELGRVSTLFFPPPPSALQYLVYEYCEIVSIDWSSIAGGELLFDVDASLPLFSNFRVVLKRFLKLRFLNGGALFNARTLPADAPPALARQRTRPRCLKPASSKVPS